METGMNIIGVISDTNGLLRRSATDALEGVGLILHAGDIDLPAVLDELTRIAPVHAVRGNMDVNPGVRDLPAYTVVHVDGFAIGVTHDRFALDVDPTAEGLAALVHGHSHRPAIEEKNGIYYINPGSAGPRRFRLPVTVGRIEIRNGKLFPRIIEIEV